MSPTVLEPQPEPELKPQPQSKSDQKPKWDAGQKYISHFAHKLSAFGLPYFTPGPNTGITVVTLDLRSGEVPDGGPRFIKPASRDEIKKFVECNRPWERYDLKPIRGDELDDPKLRKGKPWAQSQKWYEAQFMLSALRTFATPRKPKTPDEYEPPEETPDEPDEYETPDDDDDDDEAPDEPEKPGPNSWFKGAWREMRDWRDTSWKKYCFKCPTNAYSWTAKFFMVPQDASKPHVNAFMIGAEPLRDDALNTGEITIATGLIAVRRCRQKYNGYRYIPATIFSLSDRQIRVVQVWHDREKPRALHIRRSPTMEFWEGARGNWEDWITILCYMIGDSILDDGGIQVDETKKDG